MIALKILKKEDFEDYIGDIIEYYAQKYKIPVTVDTVLNSTIICLAYEQKNIIGAVRVISDLSRHGMIVDLFVDEKYRKNKIGTLLLQNIITELRKYKVKNISISTEPGVNWLINFYEKNGFKIVKDSIYLELVN